jgi:hypothetical protein
MSLLVICNQEFIAFASICSIYIRFMGPLNSHINNLEHGFGWVSDKIAWARSTQDVKSDHEHSHTKTCSTLHSLLMWHTHLKSNLKLLSPALILRAWDFYTNFSQVPPVTQ